MDLARDERKTGDTAAQASQPARLIAARNQLSEQQRLWIAEAARRLRRRELRDAQRTGPRA